MDHVLVTDWWSPCYISEANISFYGEDDCDSRNAEWNIKQKHEGQGLTSFRKHSFLEPDFI